MLPSLNGDTMMKGTVVNKENFSLKKRVIYEFVLFTLAIAIILIFGNPISSAKTIYVDDGGGQEYEKIQDAINASEDGDTIRVYAGIYYENMVVNKTVSLIGNGTSNTTIDEGGNGIILKIEADFVNISDLSINNGNIGIGIVSSEYGDIKIENCIVENNDLGGILIQGASHNKIINCEISANNNYGISVGGNNNLIENCTIYNNIDDGIKSNGSINHIKNSTIYGSNSNDLFLDANSNIVLINSTFNKNQVSLDNENSELIVKWYFHILTIDNISNPINNANINIQDNENGTLDENYTTDQNGYVKWIECVEYIQNSTIKQYFTPHLVLGEKDEKNNETYINLNKSKTLVWILEDKTPPVITNITNSTPTQNSVTITWQTDEPSTSLVKYGLFDEYEHEEYNETLVTFHNITLNNLESNKTYSFVVNSTDGSGNSNESSEKYFKTLSKNKIIKENEIIEDSTMVIDGELIIGNGGTFSLINSILYAKTIIVREGGTFFADPTEIYMDGDLYIDGTYILDNTILKMNSTYDGEYKIQVNSTGTMQILNGSEITANNSNFEFKFLVNPGSVFEMKNSTLSECGYTTFGEEDGRYGLTIKTNDTIIDNSTFFNNSFGIFFSFSNNNTIMKNDIFSNNEGIRLSSSCVDNNITGCNISDNGYGVRLYSSDNNTFFDNLINDNSNYGIYISSSKGNNFTENNLSNNFYGYYLTSSIKNYIQNNELHSNTFYGIYLISLSNDNEIFNNTIINSTYGISSSSSTNNITFNKIMMNSNYGIQLSSSHDNNIINNSISYNSRGIYLSSSDMNNITNNDIFNNTNGIYFSSADDNQIFNTNFSNNGNGTFSSFSKDNKIINSRYYNSTYYDFNLTSNSDISNINSTFNNSKVYFGDDNSKLFIKWYLNILVFDRQHKPILNASLRVQDNENGTFDENFTTDENGTINYIEITEYMQNSTIMTYFTPLLLTTSKDTIENFTFLNISNSQKIDIMLSIFYDNWTVNTTEIYTNETILLRGNLTIENGGNLTFNNVNLFMNCSFDGEYYIEVQGGGEFYIYDNDDEFITEDDSSIITSNDKKFQFFVIEGGILEMENSKLQNCGYSEEYPGLEINSDYVFMYGNDISENYYGIYCNNSNATIVLNFIYNNAIGINCTNQSDVLLIYNFINENSEVGLSSYNNSNIEMDNCTIELNNYDLYLSESSNITSINSTFDKENIMIDDNESYLKVIWYLEVNITDEDLIPLNGAEVEIQDNENVTFDENYLTENGTIKWIKCTEFIKNGSTRVNLTPHIITANFNGKSNKTELIMDQSQILKMQIQLKDITPPELSEPNVIDIFQTSVTIIWDTDELSDTIVRYSTSNQPPYIDWDYEEDLLKVTLHEIEITGLEPGTTYYYRVNSTDDSGNTNESETYQFETLEIPPPTLDVEFSFNDEYLESNHTNYKFNISVSQDSVPQSGINLKIGTVINGNHTILNYEKSDTNNDGYREFIYNSPLVKNDTLITFWVNATDGFQFNNDTKSEIWIRVVNITEPIEINLTNGTKVIITGGFIGEGEITLIKTDNPNPGFESYKYIDAFFEVNYTGDTEKLKWINITVQYDEAQLPININEGRLRIYWWNETKNLSNKWDELDKGGISESGNFVWANLSHLTIFAPIDIDAEPPEPVENKPDLIFFPYSIELSNDKPKIGDKITIKVTIKNDGSAISNATTVKFIVDNKEEDSKPITTIEVGATLEITFEYTITKEKHDVKVTIEALLDELDPSNNEITKTITIDKVTKPKEDGGGFPMTIPIIGVALIVVVLLFLFVIKPKFMGEEDEEKDKKKKKGKKKGKKKKGEVDEDEEEKPLMEKYEEGEEVEFHDKGVQLFKDEKYEEAIVFFNKAIEKDPGYEKAWYNKGLIQKKLGRDDDALESFTKALEVFPDYSKAWFNKGIILQKLYRYVEAIECYEYALEIDPNFEKAEEAIDFCNERLEMEEQLPEDSKERVRIAKGLEVALDYDGAIKIYQQLNMDEDEKRVKNEKAKSHESYHELEEALHIFQEIESTDDINRVKTKIAKDLEVINKIEEALEIYIQINSVENIKRIKTIQAVELESIDEFDAALEIYREIESVEDIKRIRTMQAVELENIDEFEAAIMIYEEIESYDEIKRIKTMLAEEFEEMEEFENAAQLYVELEMWDEARRVRLNARKPSKQRVKPKWNLPPEEEKEPEEEIKKASVVEEDDSEKDSGESEDETGVESVQTVEEESYETPTKEDETEKVLKADEIKESKSPEEPDKKKTSEEDSKETEIHEIKEKEISKVEVPPETKTDEEKITEKPIFEEKTEKEIPILEKEGAEPLKVDDPISKEDDIPQTDEKIESEVPLQEKEIEHIPTTSEEEITEEVEFFEEDTFEIDEEGAEESLKKLSKKEQKKALKEEKKRLKMEKALKKKQKKEKIKKGKKDETPKVIETQGDISEKEKIVDKDPEKEKIIEEKTIEPREKTVEPIVKEITPEESDKRVDELNEEDYKIEKKEETSKDNEIKEKAVEDNEKHTKIELPEEDIDL